MPLASAAIPMFFVMDPLGTIPLSLSTLRPIAPSRRLRVVAKISRFLGNRGPTAIERPMGMVLVASAVQTFLDGEARVRWNGR